MTILNLYDSELVIPGDWMSAIQNIQRTDGTVMVLGKNDSGKTSFVKLLTHYLVRRNRKVAFFDADIGQSTLGPPGTIGMAIVDKKRLTDGILADYMLFIGAISPDKCIDRFLERIYQLYTITQKENADTILIDTTGLVIGKAGVYLKSNLIKKINPTILIALQFDEELEPILLECASLPSTYIYRITPYKYIMGKSWSERKMRRKKQFSLYFRNSQLHKIMFSEITINDLNFGLSFRLEPHIIDLFRQEFQLEIFSAEVIKSRMFVILLRPQNIPTEDKLSHIKKHFKVRQVVFIQPIWFQNLLVSVNTSEGLSKSLGIIKNIDFKRKEITAYFPIPISFDNLDQIEFGQIKVKPDGSELPLLEPEQY